MATTAPILVATEGQSIPGLRRQPFTYGDGAVESLLGTDIIAATGPLVPGERVLVISPTGAALWATVAIVSGELLVTA